MSHSRLFSFVVAVLMIATLFAGLATVPVAAQAPPTVYLNNSWVQKSGVYEGSIHFHSTNGGGSQTPAQMSAAYRAQGFNFTVLTDHNVMMTGYAPASGITAIKGEEITTCEVGRSCSFPNQVHTVAIGMTSTIGTKSDSTVTQGNTQSIIDQIVAQGCLASLAHPAIKNYLYITPVIEKNFTFVETQPYVDQCATLTNAQAWQFYDNVLAQGYHVWAYRGDDAHDSGSINASLVMVNAPSNSAADILANLKAGNFYTANGIRDSGTPLMARISSITTSSATITIKVPQNSTIQWIKSGGIIAQTTRDVTTDSYTAQGNEGYVRIVISRSDNRVAQAWSQPILVTRGVNLTATVSQTSATPYQNFTIKGRLTANSAGLANRTISLERSFDNKTFCVRTTRRTNSSGWYTLSWNATTQGIHYYRATFAGDAAYQNATSNVVTVAIKYPTTLTATAPATASVGKNISVTGRLVNGTTPLKSQNVTLQRSLDNSTWHSVTMSAATTNATGGYKLTTKETAAGTYFYRAYYAGSSAYAAAASKVVKVVVS